MARIEVRHRAAGTMAVRAVGIQIRAGPVLQAAAGVVGTRQCVERGEVLLLQRRREQPQLVPATQLVLGAAVRITQFAIQLTCLRPQLARRVAVVADRAVLAARVIPGLHMLPTGRVADRDVLRRAFRQQLRIAEIRAPFVGSAVDAAAAVHHQQARFQASHALRLRRVQRQLEGFHEHRARRKLHSSVGEKTTLPSGIATKRDLAAPSDQKASTRS